MKDLLALLVSLATCLSATVLVAADAPRPNVLLIMTDDQGWGDLGFHGNPLLKTPHLDRLASQSVELTQFHVCPVCSPTRASLLTGRYNYRTGAIDTYLGRSTMVAEELTLAEMLAEAGYRTGIFGKWHLGDNYPSRAVDQGFAEALVHRGGGVGQPSDPPGNTYFDPLLVHDGHEEKTSGYCSDVFTDAAIRFIAAQRRQPFFVYLPFNCPHTPLQVPAEYHRRYQNMSLGEDTAKLYGMVANIDDNVGRLMAKLDELKLADNTIVIFLTDNGPQMPRYNGVLKGLKGSVHDGGIRVPCLVRWPGKLTAGRKVDPPAAHIDITPTVLEACGVAAPSGVKFDGISLLGLLRGEQTALADRLLFFQWHRGDEPVRFRACAVRGPRYKLVQPAGRGEQSQFTPAWALYDMAADPAEQHNIIDRHSDIAARMKAAYEAWFDDVCATRGFPAPKIIVGTRHENPVTLTRQDWRGPRAGWQDDALGQWEIDVQATGPYDITVRTPPRDGAATVRLRIGNIALEQPLTAGADRLTFKGLRLDAGRARLEATVEQAGSTAGAHYVDLAAQRFADGDR